MSIQNKLSRSQANLKRKLFDNNVRLMGVESNVIRFHIEEDFYGDETISIISQNNMEIIIIYPGEVPLSRFRYDQSNNNDAGVDETNVFFFDILPIDAYVKWSDEIEKGDFIFHNLYDEKNNKIKILFRVAEVLGSFTTDITWRKVFLAPYNGIIPQDVRNALDAAL